MREQARKGGKEGGGEEKEKTRPSKEK